MSEDFLLRPLHIGDLQLPNRVVMTTMKLGYGIDRGDIITRIDDHDVTEFENLITYLSDETQVGQTVALEALREQTTSVVKINLEERPGESGQDLGNTSIELFENNAAPVAFSLSWFRELSV